MFSLTRARRAAVFVAGCLGALLAAGTASAHATSFIGPFTPNPSPIATTVPANGDVNPYGIVTVPDSVGSLHQGDLLVSNFNNSANEQGTGTTIVQIPPGGNDGTAGHASVFAQIDPSALPGPCPGGVGLTTALAVTRTGFVIVGSLPTKDGTSATAQAGCLIVLDSHGRVLETIAGGPINGPWDMTATDHGAITTLYVTNVLNGTVAADTGGPTVPGNVVNGGTVVRIQLLTVPGVRPFVLDEDVIATGLPERTDPNALVIGPTGVALGRDGTLYVADTQGNRIAAIGGAPVREGPAEHGGRTVSSGGELNAPLGMTLAPNGDVLTANGGDGNIVETTPAGVQSDVAADSAGGAGVLFGLTVPPRFDGIYFVDDGDNTLRVLMP
jgi:sugar lactone lactonase YvrE